MSEKISSEYRKARKRHRCDYCHGIIEPGEKYHHYVGKFDGNLYAWKSHEKCEFMAQELWDYIDPDDGMDADQFMEGCSAFCRVFICPDCGKWDTDECGESYCIDKMYDLLQTKELYYAGRNKYYERMWRLRDRTSHT